MFQFLQQLFRGKRAGAAPVGQWQPAAGLTAAQAKRHAQWVVQRVYRNWLGPYHKAYHLRKGGAAGRRGLRVELLREPARQGALLFYDPSIGPGNFRHLFEHLGERVLALGYHRGCHDQRTRQHRHHRETVLKQLFKPDPTDCPRSGCCNQRYGLVTVDLVSVNNQPMFIRLASNAVCEPHFTPAETFDALLAALCDEPAADEATQALVADYRTWK